MWNAQTATQRTRAVSDTATIPPEGRVDVHVNVTDEVGVFLISACMTRDNILSLA